MNEITQLPQSALEMLALWDEAHCRPGERWGGADEGMAWVERLRMWQSVN